MDPSSSRLLHAPTVLHPQNVLGNIQHDNSSPSNDNDNDDDDTCAQFLQFLLADDELCTKCSNVMPKSLTLSHARTLTHTRKCRQRRTKREIEFLVFGWDSGQTLCSTKHRIDVGLCIRLHFLRFRILLLDMDTLHHPSQSASNICFRLLHKYIVRCFAYY